MARAPQSLCEAPGEQPGAFVSVRTSLVTITSFSAKHLGCGFHVIARVTQPQIATRSDWKAECPIGRKHKNSVPSHTCIAVSSP